MEEYSESVRPKEFSTTDTDIDNDSVTSLEELYLNDKVKLNESRNDDTTNLEHVSLEISDEVIEYGDEDVSIDDSSEQITGESMSTVIDNTAEVESSVEVAIDDNKDSVKYSDESQEIINRKLVKIENGSSPELAVVGSQFPLKSREESVEIGRDCYKHLSSLTKVKHIE
jgi:hypothetical protein